MSYKYCFFFFLSLLPAVSFSVKGAAPIAAGSVGAASVVGGYFLWVHAMERLKDTYGEERAKEAFKQLLKLDHEAWSTSKSEAAQLALSVLLCLGGGAGLAWSLVHGGKAAHRKWSSGNGTDPSNNGEVPQNQTNNNPGTPPSHTNPEQIPSSSENQTPPLTQDELNLLLEKSIKERLLKELKQELSAAVEARVKESPDDLERLKERISGLEEKINKLFEELEKIKEELELKDEKSERLKRLEEEINNFSIHLKQLNDSMYKDAEDDNQIEINSE